MAWQLIYFALNNKWVNHFLKLKRFEMNHKFNLLMISYYLIFRQILLFALILLYAHLL